MAEQQSLAQRNCCLWSLISGSEATNWARILARYHLTPSSRLALFQACRGGKLLVLGEAARASVKLTLAVDEDEPDMPATMATVKAARTALMYRGELQTKLQLSTSAGWPLPLALGMLEPSTTFLQELVLGAPLDQCVPTSTLAASAATCPNLRSLTVDATPAALPKPELFPKLVELSFRSERVGSPLQVDSEQPQVLLRSASRYIRQLTRLTIQTCSDLPPTTMQLLLNPDNVGAHLRHLAIPMQLNDALLGRLLQCAPALTHLHVRSLRVESDTHAATDATWQELRVSMDTNLSSLAQLPQAAALKLILPRFVECDVSTPGAAAATAAAVSRFKQVALQPVRISSSICLSPAAGVAVGDEPAALGVGFSLLRAVSKFNPEVRLQLADWTMSIPLQVELHRGLPKGQVLGMSRIAWPAGAAAPSYASLLRMLPSSFRELYITAFNLSVPQVESICLGAPLMSEAPFHIQLCGCDLGVVQAIRLKMQQLGVYPNVVLSVP